MPSPTPIPTAWPDEKSNKNYFPVWGFTNSATQGYLFRPQIFGVSERWGGSIMWGMQGSNFYVRIEWQGHDLHVEGRVFPTFPANRLGRPDHWTPREGGSVEDVEMWLGRGKRQRKLSQAHINAVLNEKWFLKELGEALTDDT